MKKLNRFYQFAPLFACMFLLGASLTARADEIQEANQLLRQGQHAQALEKLNGLLAQKPKDAQARFLKGLILTEQGKPTDAIKIFSTLTEDYPELPEPYNNLAVLYASQGQYDKAKLALEMAIRTHPSYATAHENLGDIYAKMASLAYDRALQLDRSNTTTQTKLAMIQDLFAGSPRSKTALARSNTALSKTEEPAPANVALNKSAPAPAVAAPSKPEAAPAVVALNKAVPAPAVVAPIKPEPVPVPVPVVVALNKSTPEPAIASPSKPEPAPAVVAPSKTEPAKADTLPQPAPVANNSSEILKTVDAWVTAWSSQDVNGYLSFYAADFKTPNGESRPAWETMRKERISNPKSIQVSISNAAVKFSDGDHVTVKFRQLYSANHLKTSGNKTLLMVKSSGKWLIQEERSK